MKRTRVLSLRYAALGVAVGYLVNACSSSSGNGNGGSGASSGSNGSPKGGASSSAGGSTSSAFGGSGNSTSATGGSTSSSSGGSTSSSNGGSGNATACMGLPITSSSAGAGGDSQACTGIESQAEQIPVDMYIMMDRSISMNCVVGAATCPSSPAPAPNSRWNAVHDAMSQFVTKLAGQDTNVGIGFFGASISGGDDRIDCDITNYSTPKVPIGPIDTTGQALVDAIDANQPGGLTPTAPALQGAVNYGTQWATAHPGRQTVVVLVTDGYPTQCTPTDIPDIATIAQQAYDANPSVRTYVVGLAAGFNLDTIAMAGGSNKAFVLDKDLSSGNVTDALVNALLNITKSQLACQYTLPTQVGAGMDVDPTKVQLIYTPAVGDPQEVPLVNSAGACDRNPNGGWYYDNPVKPTVIYTCPCTCANFQAGDVKINVGCKPHLGLN